MSNDDEGIRRDKPGVLPLFGIVKSWPCKMVTSVAAVLFVIII